MKIQLSEHFTLKKLLKFVFPSIVMMIFMLLGAAKLLKQYQQDLVGTVKLVFQPDEEGFTGAKVNPNAIEPGARFFLPIFGGTT